MEDGEVTNPGRPEKAEAKGLSSMLDMVVGRVEDG